MNYHDVPLLFSESFHSADMLYLTGFWVHDPFLAFKIGSQSYGLLSALERSRAQKESHLNHVFSLEEWLIEVSQKIGHRAELADVIAALQEHFKIESFCLPRDFPAWLLLGLQKRKIKFKLAEGTLFPEQNQKQPPSIQELRKANDLVRLCFKHVEAILEESEITHDQTLTYRNEILTSEFVRKEIEALCLKHEALGDCIVAGGDQACDPHCKGSGPLKAQEWIVVDIFPRLKTTGYHGDMTRTFMKGTPTEAQKALYEAVKLAQQEALSTLKAGVPFKAPHEAAQKTFEQLGYQTDIKANPPIGFIHSTGHGLGLALHEPISLSHRSEGLLEMGMVVTVEPGLYYPGLGGVRIEDVALITAKGYEIL